MKYIFLWTVVVVCTTFLACKEKTGEDTQLKEALAIQDEALHIGMEVDSILEARYNQGSVAQNIEQLRKWKNFTDQWKQNMVKVPGVEHDHSHDGHDHSHDHEGADAASHLSPADIKKVQEEWKAAIVAVRDSLKG